MNKEEDQFKKGIEKGKKRRKYLIAVGVLLVSLIVIISIMAGAFVVRKYYTDINKVEYDNYELYQYSAGIKIEYTGKVTIERKNEITSITNKNEDMELDTIPIYFQKIDNQVLFPVNMSVVYLNNKTSSYRLNYFSIIESEKINDEESAFVYYRDKKAFLPDSFIYDGNDIYLFPYSVKIEVGEQTYELSPLSYVIVDLTNSIEIYDKKTDTYTVIEDVNKNMIAYYKKVKIDLSTDMIMYDKDNRILRKNIDKLELFNFGKN